MAENIGARAAVTEALEIVGLVGLRPAPDVAEADWQRWLSHFIEGYDPPRLCPRCGEPLVERTGRYGEFLGCSGYPECKYSEDA